MTAAPTHPPFRVAWFWLSRSPPLRPGIRIGVLPPGPAWRPRQKKPPDPGPPRREEPDHGGWCGRPDQRASRHPGVTPAAPAGPSNVTQRRRCPPAAGGAPGPTNSPSIRERPASGCSERSCRTAPDPSHRAGRRSATAACPSRSWLHPATRRRWRHSGRR